MSNKSSRSKKDIEYKEKGNVYFSHKDYKKAIESYTKAIKINPKESIYFSNRARCHYILENYRKVLADSSKAIDLNSSNIKAYIVHAQAQAKLSQTLNELFTSLNYCKSASLLAKKTGQFTILDQCKELKHKIKAILYAKQHEIREQTIYELEKYYTPLIRRSQIFEKFKKFVKHQPYQQISEGLTCPISLLLFKDPITTTSGFSYEKEELYLHLTKVGGFDPMTREPIEYKHAIKNHVLTAAVKYFKSQNPWAYIADEPLPSVEINL
ncbi:unnamed protein product [Blepharisma stoltei]|uniref:RING-type E3 ubiquitin transferase n=1 Tax=Blepharisma stoltei TaxID=1481888 RepID=A0AAU9K8I9_9CILI|nr:unnamed protein product [Blepharisma stoltei]